MKTNKYLDNKIYHDMAEFDYFGNGVDMCLDVPSARCYYNTEYLYVVWSLGLPIAAIRDGRGLDKRCRGY